VLVARVKLFVSATAEATFAFSVYDSIDKDFVPLGSAWVERELELDAAVLVTLALLEDGGWFVDELELVDITDPVDFGHVEPDYSGEYEE